jgi:signal transduction histidine kinase
MTAIFLAMVWHVRRRQIALLEVERLAALDRTRAEADQMFVRLMSHEMRTPITVARGYTELIRTAHADPQTDEDTAVVLDELGKLDRSTRRLVTLIAADRPAAVERVDIDQLLERAARRWVPTAVRRWRVESTAGTTVLDGERLETALDCLLENALKFTSENDTIEVRGRRDGAWVVIEIVDNGTGIPAEDLPHVFSTFHRGSNVEDRSGTGLGLAIVRRIVEAWGGRAAVTSTLGAGAAFTLELPAQPPAAVAATGGRSAQLPGRPAKTAMDSW